MQFVVIESVALGFMRRMLIFEEDIAAIGCLELVRAPVKMLSSCPAFP